MPELLVYDGYPDVVLDLISSRTFDDRIQLLEYAPGVLTGPRDAGAGRLIEWEGPVVPGNGHQRRR